jgi:hypothetical protein
MKWTRSIKTLLLLATFVACTAPVRLLAQVKPLAHYRFDDPGKQGRDATGNGHDGRAHGGSPVVEGALRLDGVNNYLTVPATGADLTRHGAVAFWYKPKESCQGGLFTLTQGEESGDQRLVISLNTYNQNKSRGDETHRELGVYMFNGESRFDAHMTNLHKPWFPKPDRWHFIAVSFNGRSVDIYRDGWLAETRFQAMIPDTTDCMMWIGRCVGLGGPSDYFKGEIADVRVFDQALDESQVYQCYAQGASGKAMDAARLTPHVGTEAGSIFVDIDVRDMSGGQLDARLLDAGGKTVATGIVHRGPAWGRADTKFDVSQLPAGDYTVQCAGSQLAVHWPGRAPGWEHVKVLNNFCWELLSESKPDKATKQYTFHQPRVGWIYVAWQASDGVTLSIDEAKPADLLGWEVDGQLEAMRWLDAGEHTITITGEGDISSLLVRQIPVLVFNHFPHLGPGTENDQTYMDRYLLADFNVLATNKYAYNDDYRAYWAQQLGRHSWQHLYPRDGYPDSGLQGNIEAKPETATEQIRHYITDTAGMTDPDFHAVFVDEFDPGNDTSAWYDSHYDAWITACREVFADPKYKDRQINPYYAYNMFDYEKSSKFLQTIVEGGSLLNNEVYLHELETESKAAVDINEMLADLADDWERAIPGSIEQMVVTFSFLRYEDHDVDVDFKVFMEMQVRHLATRPELFGVAGFSFYQSHTIWDEYTRWEGKLARHYGIEGATERLSDHPYRPELLANGRFDDNAAGWTLEPAEPDTIVVRDIPGLGITLERKPYRPYTSTPIVVMQRTSAGPNRMSQTITGLTPGEVYNLQFTTIDGDDYDAGVSADRDPIVSVTMDNVDMIDDWDKETGKDLSAYHFVSWQGGFGAFNMAHRLHTVVHQRVFRATGTQAQLTITDWQGDEPGGPIGRQTMFGFVSVQPYMLLKDE